MEFIVSAYQTISLVILFDIFFLVVNKSHEKTTTIKELILLTSTVCVFKAS